MSHIRIEDLKALCKQALTQEGMSQENAQIVAETLAQTDALGTHSHGTKNLHGYILKARAGGVSLTAEPEVVMQSESCAVIDAKNTLGMIPSAKAVDIACQIWVVSIRCPFSFAPQTLLQGQSLQTWVALR